MFGFGRRASQAPLRLEDARFSPEEMMALVGGEDNMFATVKKAYLRMETSEMLDLIHRSTAKLAIRMRGTGLFTDEDMPGEELARAVRPLWEPGVSYADDIFDARAGLFMGESGWTAIKRDGGFGGGWAIHPLDPSMGFDAAVCFAFDVARVSTSKWDASVYITDAEESDLIDAVNDGSYQAMSKLAVTRGLPLDALIDLSEAAAGADDAAVGIHLFGCDTRGTKRREDVPIVVPAYVEGWRRSLIAQVVPGKGFYVKRVRTPRPGDDETSLSDPEIQDERMFVEAGFVGEGGVFERALGIPEWMPEGTVAI